MGILEEDSKLKEVEYGYGICEYVLMAVSFIVILLTFPLSLCCTIKVIQEYQRAVIFRLGRLPYKTAKGPGIFFIIPCLDNVVIADLRTQTFDVPPQEILTKDSVTVTVDAVVYIRIFDPISSVIKVENAQYSTRTLASTTLRNIFGTKTLQDILIDRDSVSKLLRELLDDTTSKWGVAVERVEVKDVSLPVEMQRVMASEAEASREAKAQLIAAEGEQNASKALKQAADTMAKSPMALQLRYLQTLNTLSAENNSTILFPIPISMATHFSTPGNNKSQNHEEKKRLIDPTNHNNSPSKGNQESDNSQNPTSDPNTADLKLENSKSSLNYIRPKPVRINSNLTYNLRMNKTLTQYGITRPANVNPGQQENLQEE